ncbi:MAG: hypothetical protein IPK93_11535 [Solirubrobacterales bacterium]|nr:hypothetical protein [Solirubrobacterales bacterium]
MAAGKRVVPVSFGGGKAPAKAEALAVEVRWPRPDRLNQPLSVLPGVGPTFEEKAREAGVETVFDLLWRVPRSYGDAPERSLLGDLEPGTTATVIVEIVSSRRIRVRRRGLSVVEARVADSSGERKAVWFNQPWMENQLRSGSGFVLEGRLEKKGFVVSAHEPTDVGPDAPPVTDQPSAGARRLDRVRPA